MTKKNNGSLADAGDRVFEKHKARRENDGKLVFFDSEVTLAENTIEQVNRLAALPFVERVSVMPDAHLGMGATIGTVMATEGAIIPAAVGVDIGCGIDAYKLNVKRDDLSKGNGYMLSQIMDRWEKTIPHGRSDNGGENDVGKHAETRVIPDSDRLIDEYMAIAPDNGGIHPYWSHHLGTLGTGNHFVELAYDQYDGCWLLIHSGSRGPGARLANHFIKRAKELAKQWFIDLPDPDLAYFPAGTEEYGAYIRATMWAQRYAARNRDMMAVEAVKGISRVVKYSGLFTDVRVKTPHNFIRREKHFGKEMWITRKGASSALEGELVCIPGSMGTKSYVCKGLGNFLSMHSSSHGAGRAMSRRQAESTIGLDEHVNALSLTGVRSNNVEGTVDESPAAYKDIDAVMASQTALVQPIYELTPLLNMKG